jgi:hypothetical protein
MKKEIGIVSISLLFLLAGCGASGPSPSVPVSQKPTISSSVAPSASSMVDMNTNTPTAAMTPEPTASSKTNSNEKALPTEISPIGDIPDTQAFVKYTSTQGGYSLEVPEGWARTVHEPDVSFIDKFNGVNLAVVKADKIPTTTTIKDNQAADLVKNGRAVKILGINEVTLPIGKVILVKFESNSEPNSVTNKQVRQDNENYYYYKDGKMAVLTLWAPLGADNVDQWKKMSESMSWN